MLGGVALKGSGMGYKMGEELNSLKELYLPYSDMDGSLGWIDPQELRKEAIKWVKDDSTFPSTKEWIKHFFNLTEEDLK